MKKFIIATILAAAVFGSTAQAQTDNIYVLELNQDGSGWSAYHYSLNAEQCMIMLVIILNNDKGWKPENARCTKVEIN